MTKQFRNRVGYFPRYKGPSPDNVITNTRTVQVDMMTGRMDQGPDQLTTGTEDVTLTKLATGLAFLAMASCMQGGVGVPSPRVGESSAVIAAPDAMPRNKR